MSAVDQAYRYAINLPCDWIIVTSMRETRLYHKGSPQNAYECFETTRLAADPRCSNALCSSSGPNASCPPNATLICTLCSAPPKPSARTHQPVLCALRGHPAKSAQSALPRELNHCPQEILRCIQKLLDRVLFCAFCEDRGLLPPNP